MDFNTVLLNKSELQLLKKFKRNNSIKICDMMEGDRIIDPSYSTLTSLGFVMQNSVYDAKKRMDDYLDTATITKLGRDYLEFYISDRKRRLVPYVITTSISVIALIKSFLPEIISGMKLLAQLWQ